MKYWVFHEGSLSSALAAHEAKRQRDGATEQQAKDETQVILDFLTGDIVERRKMRGDDGRG